MFFEAVLFYGLVFIVIPVNVFNLYNLGLVWVVEI